MESTKTDWSWVPWTLTLIGWVIAHRLSLRAQKKNFASQVRNAARLEIAKAIQEYQDWLRNVGLWALSLRFAIPDIEQLKPLAKTWEALWEDGRKSAYPDDSGAATGWLIVLEEYEILFPKTRQLRFDLYDYNNRLRQVLDKLLFSLHLIEERPTSLELANSVFDLSGELSAFMEDLRVYLQNTTLQEITGSKVPYRTPGDPSVSRILIRADGTPYIVPSTAKPKEVS